MKNQNHSVEKKDNRLYFTGLFGVVLWFRRKETNDCTDVKRIAEELDIQGNKAASKFPGRTDVAKGKMEGWATERS